MVYESRVDIRSVPFKNRSLNEFDHDTVTSVEFYGESSPSAVRSSYQTQCLGTQRKVASGCDFLCLVGVPL